MVHTPSTQTPDTGPCCSCGNTITSDDVSPQSHYSAWGWFCLAILTVSALPKGISYTCRKCGDTFGYTTDREKRERARYT